MTIFMGNFMRFWMNCSNLIRNPCIWMNVSKLSSWSNENVKTGPCCLLQVMAHISWEDKLLLCKKLNNNGDKI
jgi:hypothetical protein